MKKRFLVLLTLISVFSLTACGSDKEEVDIFNYVDVVFKGDNKAGIAESSFKSMQALNNEKLKDYTVFVSSIKTDVEPKENLKNGDKVKVSIKYNENAYDDVEFKFADTEKTFTVKGLKEYYDADKPLTKNEYQKLSNYILEEGILNAYGNNVYEDKTNADGSITNAGVNVKLSFDSMYAAENCKNMRDTIMYKSTHSLLAFYKVDYQITEDYRGIEYLKEDQLQGSYYIWVEFSDLVKPDENEKWSYDDFDCAEHPENRALGVLYATKLRTDDYKKESMEDIYGIMNKQELLQYFSDLREAKYKELKVSK